MDLQFVPYDRQYDIEIVHCLQRNFLWMSRKSVAYVRQWISPILDYQFGGSEACPTDHALLVMADGEVVGFLGRIVADYNGLRTDNWTTWCIDSDYRLAVLAGVQNILENSFVDVFTNLTANSSMQAIMKRFGFAVVPGCTVIYCVPFWKHTSRNYHLIQTIEDTDQISDKVVRRACINHLPYGVRCVVFSYEGQDQTLFVKVYQKRGMQNILSGRFGRILSCSVREMTGEALDDLLVYIACAMHVRRIECDESILQCANSAYMAGSSEAVRLYRSGIAEALDNWTYLYTELALLDE